MNTEFEKLINNPNVNLRIEKINNDSDRCYCYLTYRSWTNHENRIIFRVRGNGISYYESITDAYNKFIAKIDSAMIEVSAFKFTYKFENIQISKKRWFRKTKNFVKIRTSLEYSKLDSTCCSDDNEIELRQEIIDSDLELVNNLVRINAEMHSTLRNLKESIS